MYFRATQSKYRRKTRADANLIGPGYGIPSYLSAYPARYLPVMSAEVHPIPAFGEVIIAAALFLVVGPDIVSYQGGSSSLPIE